VDGDFVEKWSLKSNLLTSKCVIFRLLNKYLLREKKWLIIFWATLVHPAARGSLRDFRQAYTMHKYVYSLFSGNNLMVLGNGAPSSLNTLRSISSVMCGGVLKKCRIWT
jgi:hypothetical protein